MTAVNVAANVVGVLVTKPRTRALPDIDAE
jgi:hypothetical protein